MKEKRVLTIDQPCNHHHVSRSLSVLEFLFLMVYTNYHFYYFITTKPNKIKINFNISHLKLGLRSKYTQACDIEKTFKYTTHSSAVNRDRDQNRKFVTGYGRPLGAIKDRRLRVFDVFQGPVNGTG